MGATVGIDLGTTYSVVAHVGRDGRPEVIRNAFGNPTTPSVVYLGPDGPIVGEEAKNRQGAGAEEVAAFFKREMGDPTFSLSFGGREYTPVDLSELVLRALKAQAEQELGTAVTEAVITVPAYFTHLQRLDTQRAGNLAGLRVPKIINEPTAAALAYGFRPDSRDRTLLVYDLGGGTFDVSIVRITPDEITVIATDGDHRLGGRDWDDRLALYIAHLFDEEFGTDPLDGDANALLVQVEALKRALSARESAPIRMQANGHSQTYVVTRAVFEEQTRDLVYRTEMLCNQALDGAKLTWAQIDGTLPVGGATRMPMVRACIEQLSGKPPMAGINPDEAVALGAAIAAAMQREQKLGQPVGLLPGRKRTQDVISHSLGMIAESGDGSRYENSRIIEKNSPIPCAQARPYTIGGRRGADTTLDVFLTQSESDDPQACTYLGLYELSGFPDRASDRFTVDVTYRYTSDGMVNVTALERATGSPLEVQVKPLPPDVPMRFLSPPGADAQAEPMTLYLAFDLSGSMRGQPLEEAKEAAREFVSICELSTTSVGLISFADRVAIDQRATRHNESLERAIDGLRIGTTGYGNLAQPFSDILELLQDVPGRRYAIVLADGVWVGQRRAIKAAKRCHAAGIQIIAVGFGKANREFLREIASSDEQSFFTDLGGLTETFSSIARELNEAAVARLGGRVRTFQD